MALEVLGMLGSEHGDVVGVGGGSGDVSGILGSGKRDERGNQN